MKISSPIQFAQLPTVVWIRIDGKGHFEICGQLREFITQRIAAGDRQFVLDLDQCPGMDSTFMGILLGISKQISKIENGVMDVVNANARNVQLLQNLGLTSLISLDEKNERWASERRQVNQQLQPGELGPAPDKEDTANLMLEAHEALAEARPENAARFQDVIHYLKKDLKVDEAS